MTGIIRSIAAQTSCSFVTTIALNKVTGDFQFGFNNSGDPNFLFKSGIIYDPANIPCFSYIQNIQTTISGNIESGKLNYWINDTPISFQSILPTYISGFYYIWNENKVEPNYSLQIVGDTPEYFITGFTPLRTGQNITGYFYNLNTDPLLSFRVFSGSIPNFATSILSLNTGNINGGQSGQFVLGGYSNIGVFNVPLQLNTNFGTILETLTISVTGT